MVITIMCMLSIYICIEPEELCVCMYVYNAHTYICAGLAVNRP